MSLFAETKTALSLTAERATAPRPTWRLYGTAEQLRSTFQIDDAQLAIRQIATHSLRDDRTEVLVLLAESQQIENDEDVEIGPALRNLIGQMLAMTGDLLPATKCFRRAVDDLSEDEDQRVVLLNLLITALELRDFDTAAVTVDRLRELRPPMPPLSVECGTPSTNRFPQLQVQSGPLRGLTYEIQPGKTVIGRGDPSQPGHNSAPGIEIESLMVSRRHARICDDGDAWLVEDLGSRAGTFINERRVDGPTPLSDGDCLRIADVELWFKQPSRSPAASMPDQIVEYCDQCGTVIRPESLDESHSSGLCKACREQEYRERDTDEQLPVDPAIDDTVEPPPYLDENVQFTVYRPRSMMPLKWYPLLAFAHLSDKPPEADVDEPDPVEEVQRQATAVLGERKDEYRETTQDALHAVPREGVLTMLPEMEGVKFNPPRRTFEWNETVHREEFRMQAAPELVGKTARGRLTVFLGSIILAEVSLTVRVTESEEARPAQNLEPQSARPYRKIFASYSHEDLAIVEQFENYVGMLGDEYLRDWKHLRSGQLWNDRLMEMIREADVFQLFWSQNSMRSKYVRKEWEYALSLSRPNFVRPTYWEHPFPSIPEDNLPPDDLSCLHFQRLSVAELPAMAEPRQKPKQVPPPSAKAPVNHGQLQRRLIQTMSDKVDFGKLNSMPTETARQEVRTFLEHLIDLDSPLLSRRERAEVIESCLNECLKPPVARTPAAAPPIAASHSNHEDLKRRIKSRIFGNMDISRIGDVPTAAIRRELRQIAEHLVDSDEQQISGVERDRLIEEILEETLPQTRVAPQPAASSAPSPSTGSVVSAPPPPPDTAVNIPAGDYSKLGLMQKGLVAAGIIIVGLIAIIVMLLLKR